MNNNTSEYVAKEQITDYENIFGYLPDYITTVNSILDEVMLDKRGEDYVGEFSDKNKKAAQALDEIHAYNDDFFDININQALTNDDILQRFNIKVQVYC